MKRVFLVMSAVLCLTALGFAQSADEDVFYFNFDANQIDASGIDEAYLKSHPLGVDVAKKLELLRETYTWTEPASATVPGDRTFVEKPDIYFSIQKLSKHFKKSVKKGLISEEEATQNLISAIDIGLCVRYQDTGDFESALSELKEAGDIAMVFTDKIKLQY